MKKQKTSSPEKALQKAQNICSKQEKCKYDIRRKLIEWGVTSEFIAHIINKLIKDDFINEKRYSMLFVKDKFRFNKWGRIKIEFALKQKGIPEKYIHTALKGIDDKEYDEILKKELQKKYVHDLAAIAQDVYLVKSKLIRFAQSRGFENDRIIEAIEQIINNSYD